MAIVDFCGLYATLLSQLETSLDLLTVREVAALLRVDRSYMYRLIRSGRLPVVRPTPHKTWVLKAGLQAFLEAAVPRRIGQTGQAPETRDSDDS
ncbi:MAG: helix-turn-helix domain-containing protein [Chloroflexales bacterium]|nr:helix-turn-helix domain-containing protein [Chloroflexales bacterium]